jgi:hypothetical protein
LSFSSNVKKELMNSIGARHCKIAELSAILTIKDTGKSASVDASVKKRIEQLTKDDFAIFDAIQNTKGFVTAKSECCKRAYIRGAYICVGTMAHPGKAYHMEFAADSSYKKNLIEIFDFFEINPKEHSRTSGDILYFKEAEQISTILNIMGAHIAMMEFENCRVDKDVNNAINRAANAAAANEDKVISASARHIKDILDIQRIAGLSVLEQGLAEVAEIRMDNPLASLEDIAKQLTPPISKSGVNHRLKKISEIADKYRKQRV